jgi:photosystem II stability/assembly factor-like uncharacterized protein
VRIVKRIWCCTIVCCLLLGFATPAFAATGAPAGWRATGTTVSGWVGGLDFVTAKVGFSRRSTTTGYDIYRTTNSGSTWSKMGVFPANARDVDFTTATEGYAVGGKSEYADDVFTYDAMFWVTRDGGKTWTEKSVGLADVTYYAINAVGSKVWVAGEKETIAYSSDGGATWATQRTNEAGGSNRFEAMFFLNATTGWATGAQFAPSYRGLVCRTTDGGKTWTRAILSVGSKLNSVYFYDNKLGWAAGYEAQKLLRTTDGGKTWANVASKAFTDTPLGFAFVSKTKGWLSSWGGLLQTTDGGKTWTKYLSASACSEISSVGRSAAWVYATPKTAQKYRLYRWVK